MKFFSIATLFLLTSSVISLPPPSSDIHALSVRDASPLENYSPLEKRKGGGRGKGGGGGGGGGGARPISSYSFSPQSNLGGRTTSGSGPPPAYGSRYTGGAIVPYTAGGKSPTRSITPYAFGLVGFAVFPAVFLYGSVFAYPYPIGYHYLLNGQNRTTNVTCLCQRYQVCGCDPDDNSTFLTQQIANGTLNGVPVNSSTVRTVDWGNGTESTYVNGSLPNGTTAPGGTEPSNESQISAAVQLVMGYAGYWLMVVTVVAGVMMV